MKIAIIGGGNVGWHFADRLSSKNKFQVTLHHRKPLSEHWDRHPDILYSTDSSIDEKTELVIIAVSDMTIAEAVVNYDLPKHAVVVHTAGSVSIDVLASFDNRGVIYPLQSLKKGLEVEDLPILIEFSNSETEEVVKEVANAIGTSVNPTRSIQRKKLHLAAVFASNFINHLLAISDRISWENEVDPVLLKPLVKETIRKAFELGASKAQTGPAQRKDNEILDSHLQLISNAYEREVYSLLSKGIVSYKEDG